MGTQVLFLLAIIFFGAFALGWTGRDIWDTAPTFKKGSRVLHPQYGEGTIESIGDELPTLVFFDDSDEFGRKLHYVIDENLHLIKTKKLH